MSESMALPEAVRGCWHFVASSFDPERGLDGDRDVLAFGVDGKFRRYEIQDRDRDCAEAGDYSFDGNFLILRGRKTRTFRVGREAFWRWELEAKDDSFRLYRGFVDGDRLEEIPEEVHRDIRLLPVRARIEADFDGEDVIYRVVYDGEHGRRRRLGSLSVQSDPSGGLWIGVTPLVRGIDAGVWQQVVEESLLEAHLDEAAVDDESVTMHLFDTDETLRW